MSNDRTILDLALRVSRSYDDTTRAELTDQDQDLYDLAHAVLDVSWALIGSDLHPEQSIQKVLDVLNRKPGA